MVFLHRVLKVKYQFLEERPLGKNYSKVVNILIFIFPIVIISLQVAGDIVLFILAMMGIFIAFSKKLSPFIIKEVKVFSYLTIGYFVAVCLSVLFSGKPLELAHYIPRDFYYLLAPYIALTLYKTDVNISYLIVGIKVALLVLGIIVIYKLSLGHILAHRQTGVINANVFGNLSVSLFFITLVFFQNESFKQKIFTFLSLSSGLLIIAASGSRGAWLSFLIMLGFYLFFFYKQRNKLRMRSKIIIFLIIAISLSIAGTSQFVRDRTDIVYVEISNWMSGDKKLTSVGQRLTMYKAAIDNIEDVPFFGHGLRTSNITLFKDDSSFTGKK